MSRLFGTGVFAALVVCTLLACSRNGDEHDENNFRADVIECEDALSRLEQCCPGFDPTPVLCNFYWDKSTGCGSTTTESEEPAFTRDESDCIREMSCDQLVTNKVCERGQAARAYERNTTTTSSSSGYDYSQGKPVVTSTTRKAVCP
jgi:hypothetical protein